MVLQPTAGASGHDPAFGLAEHASTTTSSRPWMCRSLRDASSTARMATTRRPWYEDRSSIRHSRSMSSSIARSSEQLGFASPDSGSRSDRLYGPSQHGLPDQPMRIIGVVENKPLAFRRLGAPATLFPARTAGCLRSLVRLYRQERVRRALRPIRGDVEALCADRVRCSTTRSRTSSSPRLSSCSARWPMLSAGLRCSPS